VILVVEADHHRVGAALLHLERAIVKAKLFYNDPETLREFPVVDQGNAYAVLHYPSALRSVGRTDYRPLCVQWPLCLGSKAGGCFVEHGAKRLEVSGSDDAFADSYKLIASLRREQSNCPNEIGVFERFVDHYRFSMVLWKIAILTGGYEQKWNVPMRQYVGDIVNAPTHNIDVKKSAIERFIAGQQLGFVQSSDRPDNIKALGAQKVVDMRGHEKFVFNHQEALHWFRSCYC
jgi:hypothetical protein